MTQTTHHKIDNNENNIVKLYRMTIPYIWSILFIIIITILATYTYLYFIPTTYEAKAIIKVKTNHQHRRKNSGIKQEVLTLQTFKINRKVLQKIDFSIQYFQKKHYKLVEVYDNSPIVIKPSGKLPIISYHEVMLIAKGNGFILSSKELGESKRYPFNQTIKTPYFSGKVIPKAPLLQPITIVFNGSLHHIYETIIKKQLKISQIDPNANLIQISFQDTIDKRATKYVKSLIKIYIEESLREKGAINQKSLTFLNKQISTIKKKLKQLEIELEKNKEHNPIEPNRQRQDSFTKLSSIDLELSELTLKEKLAQNLLTFVLNNKNLDAITPTLVEFNAQATIQLIERLSELKNKQEELSVEYTDRYPKLVIIKKKIKRINNKILLKIKNLKFTLTEKRINLEKEKNRYEQILQQELPQQNNKLISIKREYEVDAQIYTYLLKKKSESKLLQASIVSDYEIIDPTYTSNTPTLPKGLILIASAIIGLILALLISLVRALFTDKIATEKDIKQMSKLPIYGVIPFYKNKLFSTTPLKEAYHKLATNLHLFKHQAEGNIILITSKAKGEGKTTTVISLAGAFQNAKFKTIIIDLNLLQPSLHSNFSVESPYVGLSTYLSQRDNIGAIIYTTNYKNLDIIPAGPVPPNPSELLLSNRLAELFNFLKEKYDYVIIDTPAYEYSIETLALMKLTTMNLIMIQEEVSKKSTLIELEKVMLERNISNLGLVLKSTIKNDEDIVTNNLTSLTQNTHLSQIAR